MRRIPIKINNGLSFGLRNAENERMLDVTLSAKQDVLSSRRKHLSLGTIPSVAFRSLWSITHNVLFSLAQDGNLYSNTTSIGSGFATKGYLILTPPNKLHNVPYLFIASNKMSKYDGSVLSKWGIDPPPSTALTPASGGFSETVLNVCDASGDWVAAGAGFSVANEATIKQEGANSLNITVPANVQGTITRTFASPINFGDSDSALIFFWFRATNPSAIKYFTVQFALANDDFATHIGVREYGFEFKPSPVPTPAEIIAGIEEPQTESGGDSELYDATEIRAAQLPATPNAWKDVRVGRRHFRQTGGSWNSVYRMRFVIESSVAQNIYIDYIRVRGAGQDDIRGRRYKYRYENNVTGHTSNLNQTASIAFKGESGQVDVSGATPSTDPQVTGIQFFGDTASDGVFRYLGTKANDGAAFEDTIPVADMGDIDTNDNATPPPASLCAYYGNSLWLNDLNNNNRIWRSIAGRLESFKDFYIVSETDPIHSIVVLNGELYVQTTNKTLRVVDALGDAPRFVALDDIGPRDEDVFCVSKDYEAIVHFSGIYLFNGSLIQSLPGISVLFDLKSNDARRINSTNIESIRLGSDDTQLWLLYQLLDGNLVCYTYDSKLNVWTEESNHLYSHDIGHQNYHIAVTSGGEILKLYNGDGYERFNFRSDDLDLYNISTGSIVGARNLNVSYITNIGFDYLSDNDLFVNSYVDGILVDQQILPSKSVRDWGFLKLPEQIKGQRLAFTILDSGVTPGLVEIYAGEWWVTEIEEDVVQFDSGEVFLSSEYVTPLDLNLNFINHEDHNITIDVYLYIDGQVLQPVKNESFPINASFLRRWLFPKLGRIGRLIIKSSGRISLASATINVVQYTDGATKAVQFKTEST